MTVSVDPPRSGPCAQWATPEDLATIAGLDINDLDPDLLDVNLTNATDLLYRKSGSMWSGVCTETVRPVCRSWLGLQPAMWWQTWGYPYIPDLVDGTWFNIGPDWNQGGGCCGHCLVFDSGMRMPRIETGQYPTVSAAVTIDGVPLSNTAFRLDSWRYVTRTDGLHWPVNNDLTKADTEDGTWSITIGFGMAPPQPGVTACAVLAAELTKHVLGDQKCSLPLRVTNVSRQGVTYSLADVMSLLDKNRTGLYAVDLFLQTYNPHDLDRPARVLSGDIRAPRRLGGPYTPPGP